MECINLLERFGDRYRITYDPAYRSRHVPRNKRDAWYMQIPCRFGTIYPAGGSQLVVELEGHPRLSARISRLSYTTVIQNGDDFVALSFDATNLPTVAGIVRPRRRRRITAEQRERLRALSQQHSPFLQKTAVG